MARDLILQNNDLAIDPNNGDFFIGESDPQHVQDIIYSWAGWWKEFPTVGVGIKRYLGKPGGIQVVKRAVKLQLRADGYRADKINIKGDKIYITGDRV